MDKPSEPSVALPVQAGAATMKLRQGSILPRSAHTLLGLSDEENAVFIVVSHDCDLVRSPDLEPRIELIRGYRRETGKNGLANGQSPRTLHIEYEQNGEKAILELSALHKTHLEKEPLLGVEPDPHAILPFEGIIILQSWLAARYRRAAFPTALDKRLDPLKKHLSAVDPLQVVGIWMLFDPADDVLPEEEPYELSIRVVYNTKQHGSQAYAQTMADELQARFERRFLVSGAWTLIDLKECAAVADTVFSIRDVLEWKQWRLEHLSLKQDPPGEHI